MTKHAKLMPPSGAHRWINCPGSAHLCKDKPRTSTKYAAEGTAAHELAAYCLTAGRPATTYVGEVIKADGFEFTVTDDMAAAVQRYVDYVLSRNATVMYVEQELPIVDITGEVGQTGTSDAVLFYDDVAEIADLKFGQGVEVDAVDNEQLLIYAAAALLFYDLIGSVKRVRMVIVQPRSHHVSEWELPIDEFWQRIDEIKAASARVLAIESPSAADFSPSTDACRWCAAKGECTALAEKVLATVADDFVDLTQPIAPIVESAITRTMDAETLARCAEALDLIDEWTRGIRARVEREIFAGNTVPGFKLVQGKQGNRTWSDKIQIAYIAELEDLPILETSPMSPTQVEKLAKAGAITADAWASLQTYIVRAPGRPTVVPKTDKRPEITPTTTTIDDFEVVED